MKKKEKEKTKQSTNKIYIAQFQWLYNRIVYISCGKFSRTVTFKSLDNKPVSNKWRAESENVCWPKQQQQQRQKMAVKLQYIPQKLTGKINKSNKSTLIQLPIPSTRNERVWMCLRLGANVCTFVCCFFFFSLPHRKKFRYFHFSLVIFLFLCRCLSRNSLLQTVRFVSSVLIYSDIGVLLFTWTFFYFFFGSYFALSVSFFLFRISFPYSAIFFLFDVASAWKP